MDFNNDVDMLGHGRSTYCAIGVGQIARKNEKFGKLTGLKVV
jgi:hypothetical protein